jgi:hypothetical protein
MGETIAFSMCNKLFKPLSIPSERGKSREGLREMIPLNIFSTMLLKMMKFHINNGFYL